MNSRQRRRLAAEQHNAQLENTKARRMPLVIPQPAPEAPQPVVAKQPSEPIPGVVQLGLALMAKSMSVRFQGYVTHAHVGLRAAARARGYRNVRHMHAEMSLARVRAMAEADAAAGR